MNTEGTLWMGDIEPWMDESFIIDSFSECGFKPKSVKLIADKRLNRHKNFCFVNFSNLQEANNALFKLNAKKIPKTNMFFKLNLTKTNSENCKNAYVGNLSPKINDIELYNFFKSKYPSVYYASIITDKGVSRGYGFVHFSKEEEYERCLREMDGKLFHNKIMRVKEKTTVDEKPNNIFNRINYLPYIYNRYNNYNNNFFNSFYQSKFEDENSFIYNEETTLSSQEKDQDSSSSYSSDWSRKTFSENIELLESDDHYALKEKMQESVDKMFEYYKINKKNNEISKAILYYCSNCQNNDDNLMF